MTSSSGPLALLDDGIDTSGGGVSYCDAGTLLGSVREGRKARGS